MAEVARNGDIGAVVSAQTNSVDEVSNELDLLTPSEVKMKTFSKRIEDRADEEKYVQDKTELKIEIARIFKEGKLLL